MERVTLALDGGRDLEVVFKDLGSEARAAGAWGDWSDRALDPGREPWAYRSLLGPALLDVPVCLGSVSDRVRQRHWLFLESIDGDSLASLVEPGAWTAAARWHARFQERMESRPVFGGPMLKHDPCLHRWWFRRAVARAREGAGQGPEGERRQAREALTALREVSSAHRAAAVDVLRQRPTVVHGDFSASNVMVERRGDRRVRPVDWEMVGVGPRLLDLAALVADAPDQETADAALEAYRDESSRAGLADQGDHRFRRELAVCRLLRAVERCGRGDLGEARTAATLAGELDRA